MVRVPIQVLLLMLAAFGAGCDRKLPEPQAPASGPTTAAAAMSPAQASA